MAAALPTGPPQPQPGHMQMDPSVSSSREPNPQLSWEGDKMFNIYIYDYCIKRGFRKTARELMNEADLGDAVPPINARQGLLFEWWSVFWVLFQAKSGNPSQEDASVYIQHQSAQKAVAQRLQGVPPLPGQQQQPGPPMALGNQPQQAPSNPQPQPSVNRMSNGMPMQRQGPAYHANGSMPNGISPAMGGQPAQPGQVGPQGMQGQPGAPINFVGMGGQPNGAHQPPQGPLQQPGAQSMPFNPMMGGGSGQRPPMNGQPQQPGQQQTGRGPFTSPPMAHSPQGGAGGQPTPQGPQPGQPGQQAPMAQLGPSPHMAPMNRAMLPPTGVGAPMNPPTGQGGGLQNTAFTLGPGPTQGPQGQQGPTSGRPPSRTRPSPSPSMSARQPPGAPGPAPQQAGMGMMGGMMAMGGILPMPAMGGMNIGGMPGGMGQDIAQEFSHIPVMDLNSLRRDLGFGDRELNVNDKARIVHLWRSRNAPGQQQQQRKDSAPGQGGMLPPQQVQGSQQQQQQRAGPGAPPNRMKRNSSSPGNENDTLPRTESSPPDRKRIKRSPQEPPAIPPSPYPQHLPSQQPPPGAPPGTAQSLAPQQGPMQPQTPQQPGQPAPGGAAASQPMMAQQNHLMFMRQHQMAMSANGPNPGGQGHAGPPNPSVQAVMGMQMHPGQMQPPQQPTLFRLGAPPGPSGPPAPSGPPPGFSSTPLTRLGQPTKPSAVNMGPTPSPGMNGLPKDATKDNKPNGQPPAPNQQQGPASPRNATAPPTPGPSTQTAPGLQQPPPGGTVSGSATQTSGPASQPPPGVNSMLGMPMDMPGMNAGDLSMFEPGFMAGMEFVPSTDINFERDFGQWFNTTADGSGLDT